jgi:hypothetical protein
MTHDEGYVLPPNHPAFVSESYDELLKKVDRDHELTTYLNSGLINGDITINTARQHWFQGNALRAVVELHKNNGSKYTLGYGQVAIELCEYCRETYPCQTIQIIEKELQ